MKITSRPTYSNPRKRGGPRTLEGKERCSQNALKHGLTIRLGGDPRLHELTHQIGYAIAGDDTRPELLEQAFIVAEAELELQRVRQIRLTILETAIATAQTCDSESSAELKITAAFQRTLPILRAIQRYEGRFFSKRKKAAHLLQLIRSC